MKKIVLVILTLVLPGLSHAMLSTPSQAVMAAPAFLPQQFVTGSQTSTFEWGCPVSEVVEAMSSTEAVDKIGRECIEEARRAASEKPGVFDVIRVSVIVPDVQVSKADKGFFLNGTFFLETLVLHGAAGGTR